MTQEISTDKPLTQRNYGIDLLRVVSMLLICLLHILVNGGILNSTPVFSVSYELMWFLKAIAMFALNCYALISGYVGINSKYKVSNLAYLWLQVAFYSVAITAVFLVCCPGTVSVKSLIKSFFPVIFVKYWYFTAYFCLFLFIPLLNKAVNNLSKKDLCATVLLIVICFTVLTLPNKDLFGLESGLTSLWLIALYLVGGYIKKYNPFEKIKTMHLVSALIAFVVLTWLSKLVLEFTTYRVFGSVKLGGMFFTYLSPFVFSAAVCMLELFSRIKVKKHTKIITFFASTCFGVYIIHCHNLILDKFINEKFAAFGSINPLLGLSAVIGIAAAIYISCSVIDYLRLKLFELLKIKTLLLKAETRIKERIGSKG